MTLCILGKITGYCLFEITEITQETAVHKHVLSLPLFQSGVRSVPTKEDEQDKVQTS